VRESSLRASPVAVANLDTKPNSSKQNGGDRLIPPFIIDVKMHRIRNR
jgi:hypothetical protein